MPTGFRVHRDILKLGLVSFLTDVSSEMIFSVFAVVFTSIAGASSALLGLIEGLADLAASSLDYVAGFMSDRSGRRKALTVTGYAFSTAAKMLLLLANSAALLASFRIIERLGKSLRGPPRDAWLSAIAHEGVRGYSFGVHKALDKAGAIVGPLIAYGLLSRGGAHAHTFRILFWVACVPAGLSLFVFWFIDDRRAAPFERARLRDAWRTLSAGFHRYLLAAGIFSLGYFSFGFLLVRAHDAGFSIERVVLLYALFNGSFVLSAPLLGKLGDRIGRIRILIAGYLVYCLTSLGFAFASAPWHIVALFALYGVFLGIEESQSKAFIADLEPERRSTAIGTYNLLTGILYLPASLVAGFWWHRGPGPIFTLAACLSLIAAAALAWLRPAAPAPS